MTMNDSELQLSNNVGRPVEDAYSGVMMVKHFHTSSTVQCLVMSLSPPRRLCNARRLLFVCLSVVCHSLSVSNFT